MSALAKYLLGRGKRVAGSDITESIYTRELKKLGAKVSTGTNRESVADYEVVVYTDAIGENDTQLVEAKRLNKFILSRGQFLYEVSREFGKVFAISGCHGKTTCTAMLAHIFFAANKNFSAHIGGRDVDFTNFIYRGNDFLITEACEYKKNFLLLKPNVAVILNGRPDHLECYGDEEELENCYLQFANSAEVKVSLYGDIGGGLTFGFDKNADYHSKNITENAGKYSFTAYEGDCELGKINLSVYGKHNVLNALAAIAVARSAQIPFVKIRDGLSQFKGVERRFEKIGDFGGAACFADYAHHPDEIRATLRTARKISAGRLFVIFQPHTYSRTKNFMRQFVRVLAPLNNLLIYRTFAAREYYDDAGSALTLSQRIKKSRYGDDKRDIAEFLFKATADDLVLFLGAGDIYEIAKDLVKNQTVRP